MTHRPPVNVAASVFERLKQRARRTGEDFNLLLDRYVAERLLYRLSQSSHAGSFTLKGATLFAVWEDEPHRATRDIDLLDSGDESAKRLQRIFADVCAVPVVDDGLVFDPLSATVSATAVPCTPGPGAPGSRRTSYIAAGMPGLKTFAGWPVRSRRRGRCGCIRTRACLDPPRPVHVRPGQKG